MLRGFRSFRSLFPKDFLQSLDSFFVGLYHLFKGRGRTVFLVIAIFAVLGIPDIQTHTPPFPLKSAAEWPAAFLQNFSSPAFLSLIVPTDV